MAENNPVTVRDEFLRVCKEHDYRIRVHMPYDCTIDDHVMSFDKDNLVPISKPSKKESCLIPVRHHLLERSACLWIEQLTD